LKSREEIGMKTIEFLLNLKYYAMKWDRAKTFAQVLGFFQEERNNYFTDMKNTGNLSLQSVSKSEPNSTF
jgi:hypothetical protein